MKRKSILNVVIFAALVLMVFIGCGREEVQIDYRDKYTGEWHFDVSISEFNMVDSFYHEESYHFVGEITLGSAEDEIEIHYLDEKYLTLAVDEEGALSGFNSPYCSGAFDDMQHLDIFIRWGGQGGGGTHEITATR